MKYNRGELPQSHMFQDFASFGPIATKDGDFSGSMMCDLGCFTQDGKDSNKWYFGAVIQSKKDNSWFTYYEWGRTGCSSSDFQFEQFSSRQDAITSYEKQLHKKNDKRGEWYNHPSLGKILRAKKDKDCYLVRVQSKRNVRLIDAQTISVIHDDKKRAKSTSSVICRFDPQVIALLSDLRLGTISYTRSSLIGGNIPSIDAIEEGRKVLNCALDRISKRGASTSDRELIELTRILYSKIPKFKERDSSVADWMLSPTNIVRWQQDLDAFESVINGANISVSNTYGEYDGIDIKRMDLQSELGDFLRKWICGATRNVHGNVGSIKIKAIYCVDRNNDRDRFISAAQQIAIDNPNSKEMPLHQPDLKVQQKHSICEDGVLKRKSRTFLLFHGSRSVNINSIIVNGFKLPKELHNVSLTGALFGPLVYFADDWKKSAGYTSLSNSYWTSGGGSIKGRDAFMFVCDVILGNPYVAKYMQGFSSPPQGYHSIFGKANVSGVLNNEFIIHDVKQICIKHLVEFSV